MMHSFHSVLIVFRNLIYETLILLSETVIFVNFGIFKRF